jgi:type VI secretion system protein ImpH
VRQQLLDEGYRFEFFQAVRLLERIERERAPVGSGGPPSREAVRFHTRASLGFPASQIYDVRQGSQDDRPLEMVVAFMGLTGPLGLLPHAYTQLVIDRLRAQDHALSDFLDLFNHRLISFFFRAWEKYRFPVAYEKSRRDPFTEYLFDLIGMGTEGLRGRTSVPDEGLLLYAGLISQKPHSATALRGILQDYFGAPAEILQFQGQWVPLEQEYRTFLGSANSVLGDNAICGERVFTEYSKFRVRLGPLTFSRYRSFLPTGASHKPLTDLTRFLVNRELDFDVQLVLQKREVPACELSSAAETPPMLGWTTWLKTEELAEDASQVVLSVAN